MRRERQIALTARMVQGLSRFGVARTLLRWLQQSPITSRTYRAAVGYRRPFASLGEAQAAIAPYATPGHEGIENVRHHLELSSTVRPSDYPVLFHLLPLASRLRRVFDLGGNAGNLFYCYSQRLALPADLQWNVLDLPANMEAGAKIAGERGATALRFTPDWSDASGVDLLLVSGSLHYLEPPLPQEIAQLPEKPAYILINRTPLVKGRSTAAVQEASGFRVACMLNNREALLQSLQDLGYTLLDTWAAAELSMEIPGYPEYDVPAYSGAFLRRADLPG